MNFLLRDTRRKSKASIGISVAFHAVAIAALMSITFRYPIEEMFTRPEPIRPIPVRYIPLTPPPAATAPVGAPRPTRAAPVPPVVRSIPAGAPEVVAPVPAPASGMAIGAGGASAPASRDPGIGFGLRPGIPDGRLATSPRSVPRAPETEGQMAERALAAIYGQYLDSARAAMNRPGREAGDWSWGGDSGDKWGWDKNGIHIGGITIPNVVLAALPIGGGPGGRNMNAITEARTESFIRNDIQMHSGVMTHDEFRTAVKRVRERVDRERRERMEKERTKKAACCN